MQRRGASSHGLRRRDLLIGMAAGLAALCRPRRFAATARADVVRASAPPRYWINVIPTGGLDAIWTTDPRVAADVAPGVDVPYGRDDIVSSGAIRLGPHLAQLGPLADRLSVLNGVLVRTANHYTGIEQQSRLRTHTTTRMPGVFDLVGAHRDSQALAHVHLNATLRQVQTAGFFGTSAEGDFGGGADVLARLDALSPAEQRDLARILDVRLRSLRRGSASPAQAGIVDNLRQVRDYLDRVAGVPRFASFPWLTGAHAGKDAKDGIGPNLQRALWLIEHDLAAAVTICVGNFTWDTHSQNRDIQTAANQLLAASLLALLGELEKRRNRHGRLIDQTAMIVASEIGRFPYMNSGGGKDHFPQIPMLFSGPPFATGQFGATGKELEALPVSLRTGRAAANGSRIVLDDVGYTILELAGIRPEEYAFGARRLGFLARGAG